LLDELEGLLECGLDDDANPAAGRARHRTTAARERGRLMYGSPFAA
jgi:hypothetical protein